MTQYLAPAPGSEEDKKLKARNAGRGGMLPGLAGYQQQWLHVWRHRTTTDENGNSRPYTSEELTAKWAAKVEDLTRRGKFGLRAKRPKKLYTKRELKERRARRTAAKGKGTDNECGS